MRLSKKSDRLELQEGQINSAIAKGYSLETYKGIGFSMIAPKDSTLSNLHCLFSRDEGFYERLLERALRNSGRGTPH